jgi:hypothetical protein
MDKGLVILLLNLLLIVIFALKIDIANKVPTWLMSNMNRKSVLALIAVVSIDVLYIFGAI